MILIYSIAVKWFAEKNRTTISLWQWQRLKVYISKMKMLYESLDVNSINID
ncbi:hypothetical protein KAI46_10240 [bacterium]|nr:hypothetical protein [bacterium]